jgi:hypothetical protein
VGGRIKAIKMEEMDFLSFYVGKESKWILKIL